MSLFKLSPIKEKIRNLPGSLSGRSGNPTDSANSSDADWQAGYLLGCHSPNESFDDLRQEWDRRGQPSANEKHFKSWKDGYWAGVYSNLGKSV